MNRLFFCFSLIFLLGFGTMNAVQAKTYTKINQKQLVKLLVKGGYAASASEKYDNQVEIKFDGYKTFMFIDSKGITIEYVALFTKTKTDMEHVNKWNQNRRYSRSYIDSDGDLFLKLDLDLTGGVTDKNILHFAQLCKISFEAWRKEVVF